MIALAHVLTHGSGDAEDIVHESFIILRAKWPEIANPGAYLRQTVVHACYHYGRDRRRREDKVATMRPSNLHADPIDELWDLLPTLSDRQRQAIVLHYYEDLSVNDIGELTEQAVNTVKSHLDRGRKALRKALER